MYTKNSRIKRLWCIHSRYDLESALVHKLATFNSTYNFQVYQFYLNMSQHRPEAENKYDTKACMHIV